MSRWNSDRAYPVVIEETRTYLVWVDAESAEDAVRSHDQPWELVSDVEPADADMSIRTVDQYDVFSDLNRAQGPVVACQECGQEATDPDPWAPKYIRHTPDCSQHVHRVRAEATWIAPGQFEWSTVCSCKASYRTESEEWVEPSIAGPFPTREEAAEAARTHVVGRLHSKNLTVGITDDSREVAA